MKVGILEARDDSFVNDIASSLGLEFEFLVVKENCLPPMASYSVIIDRLSFNNPHLLEYLKTLSLNGTYVINNPFSTGSVNKIVDAKICDKLGIPRPKTIVLPQLDEGLCEMLSEPDIDWVIKEIELPCVLKPYNGYAWDNVYVVNTVSEFKNLYNALKSDYVMLAQEFIEKHDYYRVFCVGKKDVFILGYDPKPMCMGRYFPPNKEALGPYEERIRDWTIKLNNALDLDFNALEWCVDPSGKIYVIDAFNEVPEVSKNNLPKDAYSWIVSKFVEMIKEKISAKEKNKTIFGSV